VLVPSVMSNTVKSEIVCLQHEEYMLAGLPIVSVSKTDTSAALTFRAT